VRSLGYHASKFALADEFLKSEQVHDTSCLITDVQMPGLSGIDLQERLIARGHRIPIIFMTAYPNDNVRARAMKAGAVCFLNKPFSEDHFIGSSAPGPSRCWTGAPGRRAGRGRAREALVESVALKPPAD
jgi:FixJ family two-component response regulator